MAMNPQTTRRSMDDRSKSWREANTITDWEFAQIGELLCYHSARDLALMVVRLEGQIEVYRMLRRTEPKAIANG